MTKQSIDGEPSAPPRGRLFRPLFTGPVADALDATFGIGSTPFRVLLGLGAVAFLVLFSFGIGVSFVERGAWVPLAGLVCTVVALMWALVRMRARWRLNVLLVVALFILCFGSTIIQLLQ